MAISRRVTTLTLHFNQREMLGSRVLLPCNLPGINTTVHLQH